MIFVLSCVSRKCLFYRLSGASVILSGIVKQCHIYITYTNVNGYLIHNLIFKRAENAFAGEAQKAGFETEEDLQEYMKEIRKEVEKKEA